MIFESILYAKWLKKQSAFDFNDSLFCTPHDFEKTAIANIRIQKQNAFIAAHENISEVVCEHTTILDKNNHDTHN